MAVSKSDEQKAINDILKSHSSKLPAFTELDFRKEDSSAFRLEKLYVKMIDKSLGEQERFWTKVNFDLLIHRTLLKSGKVEREDEFDGAIDIARSYVAKLFGLQNKPLIDELICMEYVEASCSDFPLESEIYMKVNAWVDCCQFVNTLIKYLKKKYPKWSSMSKEEKRSLRVYDLMKETSFHDNSSQLQYIVDFLDQDYGLNQKSTAKAHCLLSLKLPNINTLDIAKKVEKYSSFTK